jgi:ACS family hexuronate transporter-like MFS transporter
VAKVGYDPFFVALGVLDLAGAALLWTLVRDPANLPPGKPVAIPAL